MGYLLRSRPQRVRAQSEQRCLWEVPPKSSSRMQLERTLRKIRRKLANFPGFYRDLGKKQELNSNSSFAGASYLSCVSVCGEKKKNVKSRGALRAHVTPLIRHVRTSQMCTFLFIFFFFLVCRRRCLGLPCVEVDRAAAAFFILTTRIH